MASDRDVLEAVDGDRVPDSAGVEDRIDDMERRGDLRVKASKLEMQAARMEAQPCR